MPLFIVQSRLTREYLQGGIARPEDRQAAISQLCEQAGGRLVNLYFTTGPHDFAVITEMPDAQTVSAAILAAAARGGIESTAISQAFTPAEAKTIFERARTLAGSYKPMGG